MPTTLSTIKKEMEQNVGKKLVLTAQTGRKRHTEHAGVLSETYPSIFIVDLESDENAYDRVSYSYADILTETVAIEFV
ncbi:Veg family protein [Vagococcus zengguangii]|uniref:Uncharacterized protein n=1 Tax=Vagococcus zengguangii TaxID=2571750 RepID=A0A4D7CV97_9ENTE|nr:Veg family protein [Vagococcus zengguangii]QCI87102.1 hypothetical protein FA707_09035 [Vagococcus zengguangii]TLG80860.1 hypothetical protein FE258_02935 [Vagococcus zengguangii]